MEVVQRCDASLPRLIAYWIASSVAEQQSIAGCRCGERACSGLLRRVSIDAQRIGIPEPVPRLLATVRRRRAGVQSNLVERRQRLVHEMSLRLRLPHQPALHRSTSPDGGRGPLLQLLQRGKLSAVHRLSAADTADPRGGGGGGGVASAAEGKAASAHFEPEEGDTATEDDEGGPEHAVDDVRRCVEFLDDRLRLRLSVVVTEEVGRLTRSPLADVLLDRLLVLLSRSVTDTVRTLQNNNIRP